MGSGNQMTLYYPCTANAGIKVVRETIANGGLLASSLPVFGIMLRIISQRFRDFCSPHHHVQKLQTCY
jgi:hypothetical protein